MRKIYILFILPLCFGFSTKSFAQCAAGEVEVSIDVHTDMYGYEIYWELVPGGNPCGVGTIASGGNFTVGCGGAEAQEQDTSGYGDHLTYNEGPWCLQLDSSYTLIYIDDWGDGGPEFTVNIGGYPVYSGLSGTGGAPSGSSFNIVASLPPAFDIGLVGMNMPLYVDTGNTNLEVDLFNYGTATINSFTLNYTVNGGATVTETFNSLSIAPFTSYHVVSQSPLDLPVTGSYQLEAWVENPNGQTDVNASNNNATGQIDAGPTTQNIVTAYINTTPTKITLGTAADGLDYPRDLDFHPTLSNNELWVVNRRTESEGGSTVTYFDAGTPQQTSLLRVDGNAWHFMSLPTGIAFSENGNFSTAPGVYDANHNGGDYFTGPSLWSSDSLIYAQPSGGNGSHLDMLHESPYCMGIAAESGNAFWLYDAYHNAPVRYDFAIDHGPGNDDHSDGVIRQYTGLGLQSDPTYDVVSHMILDKSTNWLYIVDTGNDRVLRMDINSGMETAMLPPHEPVAEYTEYDMATWEVVADTGLVEPSGVDLIDNFLLVSDHNTGDIIVYDISGTPVETGRIHTNDPGIMGIKIAPDGSIWYVNATNNELTKLQAPLGALPEANFVADDNTICPASCVQFIDQSTAADSYIWIFPGGNPATSTDSAPFVCYNESGFYDVTLIVSNVSGSDTLTMPGYVTVFQGPDTPVITMANDSLSIVTTAPIIHWYLDGNSISDGNVTQPIIGNGIYSVLVQDANGCVAASEQFLFGLLPQIAFTADQTNVCPGTCVMFDNQTIGADTYQWIFIGGNPTSSADTVPTVCYAAPGSYTVWLIATNAIGSDTVIMSDYITVFPAPIAPIISSNGIELSVPTGFTSYQWYANGAPMVGADSASIEFPNFDGAYWVVVTDANGCEATTDPFIIAGVASIAGDNNVNVYPNPTNAFVTISTTSPIKSITIENALGQRVASYKIANTLSHKLSLQDFVQGSYVLAIETENGLVRKQIAVVR